MNELLNTFANLASVIVAIVALVIAFRSERRNQTRFEEQLQHSQELVQAQIRPFLVISSQMYVDKKSVRLVNRGLGSAVITKLEFTRGQQSTTDLVELFQISSEQKFKWESFRRFSANQIFVGPEEGIDLIRLSEEHLLAQGLLLKDVHAILTQWQEQKSGIQVVVEYEDALGNDQPTYQETLN